MIDKNNQSEKIMNNRDEPFKDFIEKKLEQQRLEIAKQPVRFKVVSSSFLDGSINSPFITVYYDTVTKVMYQCIADRYGVSGINVMYNPDGSIMLYDNRGECL